MASMSHYWASEVLSLAFLKSLLTYSSKMVPAFNDFKLFYKIFKISNWPSVLILRVNRIALETIVFYLHVLLDKVHH